MIRGSISSYLPRRSDYNLRFLREDLFAGLTVAVVALPLALGFGVTSGAGATAGLVAAIFGGSSFQVSGPTGAMTVVLLPIVSRYGATALQALVAHLEKRHIRVIFSALQGQPREILERSGILAEITQSGHAEFPTTAEAITAARAHVESSLRADAAASTRTVSPGKED